MVVRPVAEIRIGLQRVAITTEVKSTMDTPVRPRYLSPPVQDAIDSGRIILSDGTSADVRCAHAQDHEALAEFFERLSPEAHHRRFFSLAPLSDALVTTLCDNSDPTKVMTLLVTRILNGKVRIVATGSYLRKQHDTAEVAFAVDDTLRGKGLATLLLERLALAAVQHGYRRFWAVTHFDNQPMLDVFRNSGFEINERPEGGEIDIDLSVLPNEKNVAFQESRDRIATVASLRPFFRPAAVAVVGASRDSTSIGAHVLDSLVRNRFQGPVYPVNPKATVVGCIHAYPSVRDLPETVELAIVVVPRDAVLGVVDDCGARGVRALVVITAGFAETDSEGRALQKELVQKVRGYGMRLIGPNCMGLLNTHPLVQLAATFSPVFPAAGRIAMSSQSGALGLAVLAAASRAGIGLSKFVSVGNKADVSGNDLLQYWEEDPDTDVILLYLESFGNPRRFSRIARQVSRRKPIVTIKSGRSKSGSRAAGSHTAALTSNDSAVDALFRQSGVIRADTLEEMFDIAAALGNQPLPPGRRVGIITNAGGPGILCADACEAGGLLIPEFSSELRGRLQEMLPKTASLANPIDMIASASPQQYRSSIETVLASQEVDALMVLFIPVGLGSTDEVLQGIAAGISSARAAGATDKPVYACLMMEPGARTQLRANHETIPCYSFPEAGARAVARIAAYAEWRAQPEGMIPDFTDLDLAAIRSICRKAMEFNESGWLSADETREVLSSMRMPQPKSGFAKTSDEAVELGRSIGFPVAVKLASRAITHKTEMGGVCLNLANADAVRSAFANIRDRLQNEQLLDSMDGVVVQQMLAGGVEIMMGATHDPLFGPLVAFGLGGIHVEILADVCFRLTPLTDRDAAEMVRSIRGAKLLNGYRGHPAANISAIEELLLRLSRLVEEVPEILEVDLNPVFALSAPDGCMIADARIRLQRGSPRTV